LLLAHWSASCGAIVIVIVCLSFRAAPPPSTASGRASGSASGSASGIGDFSPKASGKDIGSLVRVLDILETLFECPAKLIEFAEFLLQVFRGL
jgi:hypothetical protein